MLQALRLFQVQGKIEAAERNFTRMLAATPHHIHARLGVGYCAWLTGDNARAAIAFEEAIALDQADEDAAIDCAIALTHIGRYPAADAFLAGKPETPSVLAARGNLAAQHGKLDGAVEFYRAALAAEKTPSVAAFHRLITLYRRLGRFDEALEVLAELAVQGHEKAATVAHTRGVVLLAQGQRDEAIAAFRAGLMAEPTSELCILALAREYRGIARNKEADALLAGCRETVAVLLERSDLALALRDPEAARLHAEAADRLQPKRPDALMRLLRIEIDQENYAAARTAAERILDKGGEFRLQYLRAMADVARAEEDDLAVKMLMTQLVALQPKDAHARLDLARALRKLGEGVEAAVEVAHALDSDPQSTVALDQMGEQALRDRDYPAARHFFRRVLEIAPEHVHHHLRLVRLLQTMDSDEQNEVMAACVARFGAIVEVRSEQIRHLRDAGQLGEALIAAEAAIAAYPASFILWSDVFSLTLQIRSAAEAERVLMSMPAQNRRDELIVTMHRAMLAIRRRRHDEARRILEGALKRDPHNRSTILTLFLLSQWRNDLADAKRHHLHLAQLSVPERLMAGETTNASQSHTGQLINDMMLDPEAMEGLELARSGTSRGQLRRLMQLVRERPDHIPTAQAVVVTLAEAGRFTRPPMVAMASETNVHIPKRVAQYWDAAELPRDLRAYSESWQQINPGFEYRLFNDATARAYLEARLPPPVLYAYIRARDPTTRADLFRLAVLALDGGVWSDMDDRCQKPIGQLFRTSDRAVFWQERSGYICNNFMAVVPDHSIMRRALVTAVTAINRGDHDKVWMLTGPGLITRCFAQDIAAAGAQWSAWLEQVNVISEFDLCPVVAIHCSAVYKRQGRHWHKEAFQRLKAKRA
ncbi:tetratricopeptide repeat protein [Acidisoma cellulosilytica]|uniref:Tetratricopeptide repeat protein n=1 Tax=Acidisoma cellulosilyticum TaxID=2802395 RepID=A0A963Z7L1_9PROT|nr:tetratricopeptide repeat protein [Acidisoma cellulosilyticum]MCB8883974.1 tetratricopeptide repeat protein [Acidisoma cellulosilyticum]